MKHWITLLAICLFACDPDPVVPTKDLSAPDLSIADDLKTNPDLASPDLEAYPDLSHPSDLIDTDALSCGHMIYEPDSGVLTIQPCCNGVCFSDYTQCASVAGAPPRCILCGAHRADCCTHGPACNPSDTCSNGTCVSK